MERIGLAVFEAESGTPRDEHEHLLPRRIWIADASFPVALHHLFRRHWFATRLDIPYEAHFVAAVPSCVADQVLAFPLQRFLHLAYSHSDTQQLTDTRLPHPSRPTTSSEDHLNFQHARRARYRRPRPRASSECEAIRLGGK